MTKETVIKIREYINNTKGCFMGNIFCDNGVKYDVHVSRLNPSSYITLDFDDDAELLTLYSFDNATIKRKTRPDGSNINPNRISNSYDSLVLTTVYIPYEFIQYIDTVQFDDTELEPYEKNSDKVKELKEKMLNEKVFKCKF